jgi:hypothetical protein
LSSECRTKRKIAESPASSPTTDPRSSPMESPKSPDPLMQLLQRLSPRRARIDVVSRANAVIQQRLQALLSDPIPDSEGL